MRKLAGVLMLFVVLLSAGSAFAHASLLSVAPADGVIVATPPTTLTLDFNEPVSPIILRLVAPDGRGTPLGFSLDGPRVVMPAPSGLAEGTYALSWRVISADGHPVGGATTFSIGAPSVGGAPKELQTIDAPVRSGIWVSRMLTYLGLFFGIGGVFFCRWLARSDAGLRPLRAVLAAGLVSIPFNIAFQGLDALDRPLGSLFAPEVWRAGLASSFGTFIAIAATGLLLALGASFRVPLRRVLALGAFLCVGVSLALTGHASNADPQWLTRPAVFVHTLAVAFWIGALLPLGAVLRRPAAEAVAPLRRFSAAILPLLLLLVIAGVVLTVVQVGRPSELLATDYGRVFIAKLVLVAALLGLAAFNRWGLTGAVLADANLARTRLVRSIALELGLVLLILGVVALWRFTPPPRALLAAAARPAIAHLHTEEAMVDLTATPGHAGALAVSLFVAAPDMTPLAAKRVAVDFANPGKGIEPMERQAELGPDGAWHIDDLALPFGGTWQLSVAILVSDFKEIDLAGRLELRP